MTGDELRGCWEPKAKAADVTVLSNVLDQAAQVRRGRAAMPAYRPDEGGPARGFVPVEAVERPASATPSARRLRRATGDRPPLVEMPAAEVPTPLVIEPDPGWAERTSLFGDPEA